MRKDTEWSHGRHHVPFLAVAATRSNHRRSGCHPSEHLLPAPPSGTAPGPVADHPAGCESGGLSGPPLMQLSTEVLADMYILTGGKVPIIGCGGVSTGEDAYRKIRAGASLVELYTAFAYEGPMVIPAIKQQLAECLERDRFSSVAEAVGADHKQKHGTAPRKKSWLGA